MEIKVIIPAREGSKGLLGKNLKILIDKPLVDYSIITALEIFNPNSVILTSDSELILERGKEYGIRNILRPEILATDDSPIIETILHTIDFVDIELNSECEAIILMQPTFPIRKKAEIIDAIKIFEENNLSSLISVNKMKEHPSECISIYENNFENWKFLLDPKNKSNRQSYEGKHYFINGNFYIAKVDALKKYRSFYFRNTYFFESKQNYNVDIDDIDDFNYAKYCLLNKNK